MPLYIRVYVCSCALALLAAGGCGRERELPTAVQPPAQAGAAASRDQASVPMATGAWDGFFPLELGNRWHYVYTYSTQYLPADGSSPEPPIDVSTTSNRTIVCVQDAGGRSYVVERDVYESRSRTYWRLFRQDRAGLYELQGRSLTAPACDVTPPSNGQNGALDSHAAEASAWNRAVSMAPRHAKRSGGRIRSCERAWKA